MVCAGVHAGVARGKPPVFPSLYPSEDAAPLAWSEERLRVEKKHYERPGIPLGRRMLWGFLAREGARSSEAVRLRIGSEVALDRGVVKLDGNKTDDPRAWAMDVDVVVALRAYVKRRNAKEGAILFVNDDGIGFEDESLAKLLRADLNAAGVTRSELHENGENKRRMRAHDLRGTFVTLSVPCSVRSRRCRRARSRP